MSTGVLILLSATGLLSSFVSGVFGMAGGQIFLAVLLIYMPVAGALVVFAAVQVASGAWRGWLWRRYVLWDIAWRYIIASIVMALAMQFVRFVPSKPMVYLGIGLMPFAAFALPKRFAPAITRPGAPWFCGAFVMFLQLVVGQAGNILDVFFQTSMLDRRRTVATKAVTQLASQVIRILYFGSLSGDVAREIPAWAWGALLASTIAGTSMAPLVLSRMTDDGFRKWTKIIIACFSAIYVARGVWLLALGEG